MNYRCTTLLATFALCALSACKTPTQIDDWLTRSPELVTVNPNNIAVLPIEDASPGKQAGQVVGFMRDALEKALPYRNYAPLGSVYVDANLRDAVQPGGSALDAGYLKSIATKAKEDAILAVRIKHWDDTMLLSSNRVRFDAEVVLFGSAVGKPLWSGGMRGEVVAGGGLAPPPDPRARALAAAGEFVKELIARLPKRRN